MALLMARTRKTSGRATSSRRKKTEEVYEEEVAEGGFWSNLQPETRHSIIGILLVLFSLILAFAGAGRGGIVGNALHNWLHLAFGVGYWLLPILFAVLGWNFARSGNHGLPAPVLVAGPLFVASGLGLLAQITVDGGIQGIGGATGYGIYVGLEALFGAIAAAILMTAVLVIAILVLFDIPLHLGLIAGFFGWLRSLVPERKKREESDEYYEEEDDGTGELEEGESRTVIRLGTKEADEPGEEEEIEVEEVSEAEEEEEEPEADEAEYDEEVDEVEEEPEVVVREYSSATTVTVSTSNGGFNAGLHGEYKTPPLSLLAGDKGKPGFGDVKQRANVIKSTLATFGIQVEMDEVSVGPSVTRYALKPAQGVRVSRITALANDLELALAASPIRIEAPIPGKSLVGIELPNTTKATVGLGTLISDVKFQEAGTPLFAALGKGISGAPQYLNVAKMPHMLVAGTTGSGKSVAMHAMITSLLYRNSPEKLRFIMVDPKRVELTQYNGIPHLLTPVITQAKKALLSLKWAVKEMDRRLEVLEMNRCREVGTYHKNILEPAVARWEKKFAGNLESNEAVLAAKELPEQLPYIVIIIDEMADLMQTFPKELEASIVRLAQLARATGIHLILATQRPSVNVITGLIKANIPARIALKVASQIDSRTIIDEAGAETLLGQGDMLFLSSDNPKPIRLQSAFISEEEVKKVVDFLKKSYDGTAGGELAIGEQNEDGRNNIAVGGISDEDLSEGMDDGDGDDRLREAMQVIFESKKASTSFLQRRMGFGYGRASRIIDILEQKGKIGPADGAKPREIFITESDL
jgi:S-DNA-T family DNA segregation ATPase FtsK/SpoIIIE